MKIAIHHKLGSFSERWIDYCKENNIPFKIVNAYDYDIIKQVKDCDVFMWHHHHNDFKDSITAKRILFALEHAGVSVFPDFKTGWHFDDKVAQMYLLQAISAPLVPSFVFYNKSEALQWANTTSYPKVFKLKGGAGASNVKLVKNQSQAIKYINKAFGKGFSQFDSWQYVKDRFGKYKSGSISFVSFIKSLGRLVFKTEYSKLQSKEKGYIYFQEFIANNDSDIRVIIVDGKAFAIKRMIRDNDFRASGSGKIIYDKHQINESCIRAAFEINNKIKSQSIAFDFVFDESNNPLVVEISYGFASSAYDACPGYWDSQLNWHEGKFNPQGWMIESLLK